MPAGVDVASIKAAGSAGRVARGTGGVYLAKAMPTIAARYRESITVFEEFKPQLPAQHSDIIQWLFNQVGRTKYLLPHLHDLGTVFINASLSTMSLDLDRLLDGSVVEGLKKQDALDLTNLLE